MGGLILAGVIAALLVGVALWLNAKQKADVATGAKLEAAKVDAAEVRAMQAIIQASASAPADLDGVIKDGEKGVF